MGLMRERLKDKRLGKRESTMRERGSRRINAEREREGGKETQKSIAKTGQ
jgi:hypothetical protein